MPLLPRTTSLLRTLFSRSRLDRDLDAELAAAVEALADRFVRQGLPPDQARRAAVIELGGLEQTKERVRDVRAGRALLTLLGDVRIACRGLRKAPGFTLAAVITLALGIGANTAIFSIVNAVLLEPLPYRDAERLTFVWSDMSQSGYPRGPLSGPELADLRERTTVFEGFEAIWATSGTLTGGGDPELVRVGLVTGDFFRLLGAGTALGRTFTREDEPEGPAEGILLSHALWTRRFGGDADIVGRTIMFNDRLIPVIGVMPARFRILMPAEANVPDDLEAWLPFDRGITTRLRGQMYLRVVGRLKPGVPIDAARAEVDGVAREIGAAFPEYGSAGRKLALVGLHGEGVAHVRAALLAMLGGVVILLLVAIVNVSSLIVARAASREHEIALRTALGAGRWRLFSHWLAEGLVLAALGAAAGLATARVSLAILVALRPDSLSRIDRAPLDGRVLGVTLSAALAVAVLFSLAPLTQTARAALAGVLQRTGRRTLAGLRQRVRTALVIAQVALAVVLVVGAGLLARTFVQVLRVDPGFRTDGVVTFRLALAPARYPDQAAINAVARRFQAGLAALPGVAAVGAVSHLPYDNVPNWSTKYLTEPGEDESQARRADARSVAPGYFETVGARLIDGRFFTEDDDERGRRVVVVDERLARRAWPDGSAVGRELRVDPRVEGRLNTTVTVVGVVGHIRHLTLLEEVREQVYFPVRQAPRNPMAYVVRSEGDPAGLAGPVRALLRGIDPLLPVYDFRPLGDVVDGAQAPARFTMWLGAAFAAVALLMACVGLYGVLSYSVTSRTHEIGLRLALGASPGAMVALVVREGLAVAGIGLAAGVAAAALAARYVEALLFGVTSGDPVSYLVALPILAATAAACWWPAWRASRVDPLVALRAE